MRLKELLNGLNYTGSINESAEICDVCTRPEDVYVGTLFVAVRGRKTDAHRYIDLAVENGAVCIVCEEAPELPYLETSVVIVKDARAALTRICSAFFRRPQDSLSLVGITGTNGKTSVSYMISHILSKAGRKTGVIGTLGSRLGDEKSLLGLTTPEPRDLYGHLSSFVCHGCSHAVMEVSSQGIDQKRTEGLTFDVGVFTNFSRDHLDYHGTAERYFETKSLLLKQSRTFLVNADDEKTASLINRPNVLSFGKRSSADYRMEDVVCDRDGVRFVFCAKERRIPVFAPLFGDFQAWNMLTALSVCDILNRDYVNNSSLSDFSGIPGRMERVPCAKCDVFIDFAHTPDALENALQALRRMQYRRILVVFGCGGERDKGKRVMMARAAEEYADLIFVTFDNPRSENPTAIIDDIMAGFSCPQRVTAEEDRKKAIYEALDRAETEDVVLLAGKGHETYQIFADGTHPFDEREIVKEYERGE